MRRKKKNIIFIITLLLMFLGIGYAYLTTTLSINGITDIDSNTWDVHWANAQVVMGSVSGDQVTQAPTISNDTTVSFHIRLKEPGEYYEFTIDAVNSGSIDAMVESITKKVNNSTTIPNYLKYTVQYKGSVDIEENHLLEANTSKTYKVRVEYRTDINPSDLPSTAQSLNVSFGVEYVQSNENGVHVPNYLYTTVYRGGVGYGEAMSAGLLAAAYEDYHDIDDPHPFFLRHAMTGNIVDYSELGVFINGELYYFRGGEEFHDENITRMTNLADSGSCNRNYSSYDCDYDNGIHITAVDNYSIYALWDYGIGCYVYEDGAVFWED